MNMADILPLLPGFVHGYLVVFTRVAAAIAFLPGFGEQAVPMRVRLAVALPVSMAVAAVVPGLPMALAPEPAPLGAQSGRAAGGERVCKYGSLSVGAVTL